MQESKSKSQKYAEAQHAAINTRWKVSTCGQGEECWCRVIEPETPIRFGDDEEIYIVSSGSISKIYAEHIVKLHNSSIG